MKLFAAFALVTLICVSSVTGRFLSRTGQDASVDDIIKSGSKFADTATHVIASPAVAAATKVNAFANSLPNAFAAGGAALGSAIALPIQLISSAASGAAAGATGFIVGIPVAIGSSLHASRGKDLFIRVKTNPAGVAAAAAPATPTYLPANYPPQALSAPTPVPVAADLPTTTTINPEYEGEEYDDAPAGGSTATQFLLKPIAVLVGAKSAISGAGSYAIGKGLQTIGGTFTSLGHSLAFTGNEVRGTGATMFSWGTGGREIPLLSSDEDLAAAVNVTKQLPQPIKEAVMDALYE